MEKLQIHEKKSDYRPEDVDFLPEKIAILDQHFQSLIKEDKLQGASYLISRDDKIFAHKSMGKLRADKNDDRDLMPDSIREIQSITKLFTTVAIMQLVEKGAIRLDQPVMEILEEFNKPLFAKITIFHLLTHTSGLAADPGAYFEPYPSDWSWSNKKEWIKEILRGHTRVEPGKEWGDFSAGFAILAAIISKKSGMIYEDYIMENILKPLGMKDTSFGIRGMDLDNVEAIRAKVDRTCINYQTPDTEELIELITKEEKDNLKCKELRPSGGIYSTLEDLQKFGQMFLNKGRYNNKQIISRKSVEAMTRNHLKGVKDYCWNAGGVEKEYGLGFKVHSNTQLLSPGSFSHEGAGLCGLYIDPVENMMMTFFCPLVDEWVAESIINTLNIVWSGIL
ncbi:CubicO group peptidase (beta-lactamase class C family) [Orenia metallireducens]|uniref:CubicO group peptidase, beta-lactamase class C family n=1 Tax=Orenia metallireducens TaxID=1413210 RepID=A0A285HYN1_9FIRM|nr:serine hydrolase domain-containing protein [Orenia metallireducens]PRX29302.1 CubicO group peptidase (beta-lactamase class C family) [Orenia metallireducens]SNY40804.1 CubicO group peptidase, beta-lactamase class C family [Orenia metallireducens]